MIEQWFVPKLGTVQDLAGKIYPVAAPVGDTVPPFALYTLQEETAQRDMEGDVVSYTAKIRLDLFCDDNDALCVLAAQAEAALRCQNEDWEEGYIFSSDACRGEPAGFDLRLEVHVQTLAVTIRFWR